MQQIEFNRLNITKSSMSEYYQSPCLNLPHHILQMDSKITNPHHILQMDSKITNPHHILQMDSKITNPHTKSTKKAQFPQYIHQPFFFLALWTLMVSRWSRRKYGIFSSAKSRGTYA